MSIQSRVPSARALETRAILGPVNSAGSSRRNLTYKRPSLGQRYPAIGSVRGAE